MIGCVGFTGPLTILRTIPPSEASFYGHINWTQQQPAPGLLQSPTTMRCGKPDPKQVGV